MSQPLRTKLPEHLLARRTAERHEGVVQWVGFSLFILGLVGAGFLLTPMNAIRKEKQLIIDPETIGKLPPDIALLGKLGTFRALAIDWASIRAERLKEEGKVYEAMQLHKTICLLAPRFPSVWANASWNMAYNISVMQYTPEARWQWVKNGIEILRDEGIKYNPKAVALYKELAWTYWHKIGDYLDDEHLNYKRALAVEFERVLGPQPIALTAEDYFAWFRKIVDAPRDLEKLLKEDSDVGQFVKRLEVEGLTPDDSLLDFVARHLRPELEPRQLINTDIDTETRFDRRMRILKDDQTADTRDLLLSTIRSKILREKYKLDLDFLMELMVDRYGPLDLRNAFTHSLYWSALGDRETFDNAGNSKTDQVNNARFIFFSLNNLTTRGRVALEPNFDDPFDSYIELLPDTRLVPYIFNEYMRLGKKHFHEHPAYVEGTPGPSYLNGFVTNMHNWIQLLFFEGGEENREQAENLYRWLRKYNPHPDGRVQEMYLQPLENFVMSGLRPQMDTYRAAFGIIGSFVRQALKYYALGEIRQGTTAFLMAEECYKFWMRDTEQDINDRRKMDSPRIQFRDNIETFLTTMTYKPLAKARLWRNLPLEARQRTYDRMLPTFEAICKAQDPPWDIDKAFAEPKGMDEARKKGVDFIGRRREDVQQGTRYKN
jgi:hypothetical protein